MCNNCPIWPVEESVLSEIAPDCPSIAHKQQDRILIWHSTTLCEKYTKQGEVVIGKPGDAEQPLSHCASGPSRRTAGRACSFVYGNRGILSEGRQQNFAGVVAQCKRGRDVHDLVATMSAWLHGWEDRCTHHCLIQVVNPERVVLPSSNTSMWLHCFIVVLQLQLLTPALVVVAISNPLGHHLVQLNLHIPQCGRLAVALTLRPQLKSLLTCVALRLAPPLSP